jgi:type III secretion system low calcium response chaperone LcrH/SycD
MDNDHADDFKIPQEHLDKLNDPEILRRYVEEGKTFQEILEFDDDTMRRFYYVARALLESHRHRDAADAFLFLTTLNPFVASYWIGLGMCEQFQEEFKQALVAYAMATVSDRQNPTPFYYAAACHYALNDIDQALRSLALAIEMADEQEDYTDIRERALASQKILLGKRQS